MSSEMGIFKNQVEEGSEEVSIVYDKIFMAVGKDFEENKLNVKWALQNSGGKEIFFIHVLSPSDYGEKRPKNQRGKVEDDKERKEEVSKALDSYVECCKKSGCRAHALCVEADTIEDCIIAIISQMKIGRLVMGAAADIKYNKNMKEIKSQKAMSVFLQAPTFCHVSFICKGFPVCARAGVKLDSSLSSSSSSSRSSTSSSSTSDKHKTRRVGEQRHDSDGNSTPGKSPEFSSGEYLYDDPLSRTGRSTSQVLPEVDDNGDHNRLSPLFSDHLNRAFAKADSLKMDIIEAIHQGKAMEILYHEECRRRKEIEREMETCKKERDELLRDLVNSMSENQFLRSQLAQTNPSKTISVSKLYAEFSVSEIAEATHNFNPSMKIGQGGYGNTYKGLLRHTQVAIKVPKKGSLQGAREFYQEVEVLSRLRHPNIVTLIGVCSEASALIYEYATNGSLEDRLTCKGGSPPLPWQARARIARDLCCVLIFLQSNKPQSIVHGDLKPDNILLDANLSCKLSDFGICRGLDSVSDDNNNNNATMLHVTGPKGTLGYMDPLFLSTGQLSPKSDVYSYGILVLRMLTKKMAMNIRNEVQAAFDKGGLRDVLDTSAGEWPIEQATWMAEVALRCCEVNRKDRPDVATVWKALNR